MKVFLSWSGETGLQVALAFRDWLPRVIQALKPFVSCEDIGKGTRWSVDLAKQLQNSEFGIVCVTKDSVTAPYLNFEAGALSHAVDKSRVCPFLFETTEADLANSPLVQFQYTVKDQKDVLKLIHDLNNLLPIDRKVNEKHLDDQFRTMWPWLETSLAKIRSDSHTDQADRGALDSSQMPAVLLEILGLVREQQKTLKSLGVFTHDDVETLFRWLSVRRELGASLFKRYPLANARIPLDEYFSVANNELPPDTACKSSAQTEPRP